MKSTLWWLGLIFGTLSVVMLIKHGSDYGFVAPLEVLLTFYERAKDVLFAWTEPFIKEQLAAIGTWLGLEISLRPHWRDLFVLCFIWIGSGVRTMRHADWPVTAWALLIWGTLIAFVTAIAAGSLPFRAADAWSDFAIVLIPVAGWFVYHSVLRVWVGAFEPPENYGLAEWLSWQMLYDLRTVAVVLALVTIALQVTPRVPQRGLLIVGLLLIALAFRGVWRGIRNALRAPASERSRLQEIGRDGNTYVGMSTFAILLGVAVFFALNAGLKLAGL